MYDLKRDILNPVVARIKAKKDSLVRLRSFAPNLGFEGWFKVEIIAALGDMVKEVKNKGADLLLDGGLEVELKGANDLNLNYLREGAVKYQSPCLFIGDGSNEIKVQNLGADKVDLVGYDIFSDGVNDWVVGIITPKNFKIKK